MTRADIASLGRGVFIGGALTIVIVLALREVARPPEFPTIAASPPTPYVLPTPTARPNLPLTLAPDGLGLIAFGTDEATALEQMTALLGAPDSDDRWRCHDPAADIRFVAWADLSMTFFDGSFRGYLVGIHYPPEYGEPVGVTTAEGLAVGAPVEELEALYGERLVIREPEGEFESEVLEYRIGGGDGIGGFIEPTPDGSRVITIGAGSDCFDDAG